MTPEVFTQQVANFFTDKGYLFMGIEIKLGGTFPLVMLWDNEALATRVIACTDVEHELEGACLYAEREAKEEEESGAAPCGAIGCGVWPGGGRYNE